MRSGIDPFESVLVPACLEATTPFDDIDQTDRSPRRYDEDSFSFYNRAAGGHWQRIRDVLEEWFVAYPDEHKADLRGHFRSKIAGQHVDAFWELYLHRLFSCMGYPGLCPPGGARIGGPARLRARP